MPRIRRNTFPPGYVEAGVAAASLPTFFECLVLGTGDIGLIWVTAVLLTTMGATIGAAIGSLVWLTQRFSLPPFSTGFVLALGGIPPLSFLAASLFDGAFASTLPGANTAELWLPLLGYLALAFTIVLVRGPRLRTRLCVDTQGRPRSLLLSPLFVATYFVSAGVAIELVNRSVRPSEYPDIHLFLIVVATTLLTLAFLQFHPFAPIQRLYRYFHPSVLMVALVLTSLSIVMFAGLKPPSTRSYLANHGMHTRLLVRELRSRFDFDADGYSGWLGGPDCDDFDASRNPGVMEVVGNSIDENCDGISLARETLANTIPHDHRSRVEAFVSQPTVQQALAQTNAHPVLLLSVDALRGDMLDDTPQNREQFPNLFLLIDESVYFDRTFAPATGTDLSLTTTLTGVHNPFAEVKQTLAEALQDKGYLNHAVIPREVVRYVGKTLITRGLHSYDKLINDRHQRDVGSHSTSHRTTDLGLRFLDRHKAETPERPYFLWLHYFDVHEHHELASQDNRLRQVASASSLRSVTGRYRAAVALVDRAIGKLINELQARGEWERQIVVFASDHGESLGESSRLPENHGRVLYNQLAHVPFAIRLPQSLNKLHRGRVQHPVSLMDLKPTVTALAGATQPADLPFYRGTNLLPQLLPSLAGDNFKTLPPQTWPIALNESDQKGLIRWPYKLLHRPQDNVVELYNLELDWAESHNLAPQQPGLVAELMLLYSQYPSIELDRSRRGRAKRERMAEASAR